MAFSFKPATDSNLVSLLQGGDEGAYAQLYHKYSPKIYNISRKMFLNHEDAEGVVQDVFIKIWRNRTKLDSSLSFNAYIITILRSIIIKHSKKRARFYAYEKYAIAFSSDFSQETEDYIIFSDLSEISSKVLENLPQKQKQVFMMKNFHHLSVDEIAEKLNLSKRTVENQIYRATKTLREKLVNMEVISLIFFYFFL